MTPLTRAWTPAWPCPVGEVWSHLRRGAGDPTFRVDAAGRLWRGLRTPDGVATLAVRPDAAARAVDAQAWGPGAAWALDSLPTMLGADDDPAGFEPRHPALADAVRRHPPLRGGGSGLVWGGVAPAVMEQVTGQEAFAGFRRLVRRHGERAPDAPAELDLWVQPDAAAVTRVPSWEWLQLGIDGGRSRPLVHAARVAPALERTVTLPQVEVDRRLRTLPGVGRWTSAEVRCRAHGDPDAVAFGDYHVARTVGWALVGVEVDDDGLAELLEPYAGHRYRVQRLLELAGHRHPRFGPRMAPRRHLPGFTPPGTGHRPDGAPRRGSP